MAELEAVGRIENPEDLNFEPVTVPVIGYNMDGEEVEFLLHCGPTMPMGTMLKLMTQSKVNAKGKPVFDEKLVAQFLERCVLPDSKEAWRDFLDDPEIEVSAETIGAVYGALMDYYTDRPTSQRSDSPTGPAPTKRTSRGAATAKGSTSSRSRATRA